MPFFTDALAFIGLSACLVALLSLAWCRRILARRSAPAVTLLADPGQFYRFIRRLHQPRRRPHPLRMRHIFIGGTPALYWLRLVIGALAAFGIIIAAAFA